MNTTLRRAATALLAASALTLLSACGTSALDLEVGQCLNDDIAQDQVSSVPVVECSEPHNGEVYAVPELPDGDFPGEQVINDQVEQLCAGQAFQDYVGLPFQESEIYFRPYVPTAETWADGDREIVCILGNQDGSPLPAGSLRGANR